MAKINWRRVLDQGIENIDGGKAPFTDKQLKQALDWKTCPVGRVFGHNGGVVGCLACAFYNHMVLANLASSQDIALEGFGPMNPKAEVQGAIDILDVLGL